MNQVTNENRVLNKQQLINQFKQQLDALKLFAAEYDKGQSFLFKEMAVKLRILFQDSPKGRSRSLCSQLDIENIELYDSAKSIGDLVTNAVKAPVYLRFNLDNPLIFRPNLLPGLFKSDFHYWWSIGPIVIDKYKNEYSRQKLVRFVADNDGGAHVDIELPEQYYKLSRGDGSGWSHRTEENVEKYIDPIPATIREITHEVLLTFEDWIFG